MAKMTQREAVFTATIQVLKDSGIKFEQGQTASDLLTKDHRESINAIICEGFKAGTIDLKDTPSNQEKLNDPAKLKGYTH